MSRVGKQPIPVQKNVTVKLEGRNVSVKGPKGELSWTAPDTAELTFDEESRLLTVTRTSDQKQARANHGLTRAIIQNMVTGVLDGYQRRLEIYGTGYNCKLQGRTLHLNVGFMGRRRGLGSQFELQVPDGVEVQVEVEAARGDSDPAKLVVSGCDKQKVGQFAAEIRSLRKTEPYNLKGIRYKGEVIKKKQGKALSGGG
jgi:large subunit ribosomal protein L6